MSNVRYAVCVKNGSQHVALEPWRVYRLITDDVLERHHQVRVVDESGTDYFYPAEYFHPIELPETRNVPNSLVGRGCVFTIWNDRGDEHFVEGTVVAAWTDLGRRYGGQLLLGIEVTKNSRVIGHIVQKLASTIQLLPKG